MGISKNLKGEYEKLNSDMPALTRLIYQMQENIPYLFELGLPVEQRHIFFLIAFAAY